MNKLKFILISIFPILFASCTNLNQSRNNISQPGLASSNISVAQANSNTQANAKLLNSKGVLKGWEFTLTKIQSKGQIFKEKYRTYEAADTWVMVSINVKNISGKRQHEGEETASPHFSKLIDSKGNEYYVREVERNHNDDLINKPFSPGETRSFDLLFDVTQGIKVDHLYIGIGILWGDHIRIKI